MTNTGGAPLGCTPPRKREPTGRLTNLFGLAPTTFTKVTAAVAAGPAITPGR